MIETLVEQVKYILRIIPASRNSDITLTLEIWKRFYPSLTFDTERGKAILIGNLFNLPREDNIKRVRARFQNVERKYLPTEPQIFLARAKLSEEWREFLGYRKRNPYGELTDQDYLDYITGELKSSQQTLI